jgi:ice-binding like protein/type IX secretion system substrate protein
MKKKLLVIITIVTLLFPNVNFGQAPNLGTAAKFVLFTTNGAVTNTGISQVTGNVGTNNGSNTGFGNVNGQMHSADVATAQCSADLLVAYDSLNSAIPTFFPSSTLGNGDTLVPGVYKIASAATLNLSLYLNGQGNSNALFIFQVQGSFSTNASSKIKLINGALACNVFWKVEGLVSMASGTTMRGTVVAHNAAINMSTGDTLEGRALSIIGTVTLDGIMAYTPIGCGSPVLVGPHAPALGATACYALFSSDGAVSNSGVTHLTGDVGTNVGLTTGFVANDVTGTIHSSPDGSTATCAADLSVVYDSLNALAYDINLLYPAQFGNNLVLTPHTYLLDAATTLTDTIVLNAEGDANAVFVIRINGALSTSTNANVKLINGTQSKNIYWLINGAVNIANNSIIRGTMVVNNGALGTLSTGVAVDGRLLTTNGALTTTAVTVVATNIPGNCSTVGISEVNTNNTGAIVTISPNPFNNSTNIIINNASMINNAEIRIYNILGSEVLFSTITKQSTTIGTSSLPEGIYFYKIISNNQIVQTGRLVSQR